MYPFLGASDSHHHAFIHPGGLHGELISCSAPAAAACARLTSGMMRSVSWATEKLVMLKSPACSL